uniref:DegT/DnrJ/EryC1/StrS family aminotransferase n=1 Tax=Flavobacterium sp. TaxID=239 RepID=UPI0040499832
MEKRNIKLSKSSIGREEINAVEDVLKNEYLGMGSYVKKFEDDVKSYLGTDKEVVCVNTGTAALHLAVEALPFDDFEILVPSITYVASYSAIVAGGAIPISCEVDSINLFIDLDDAKNRITSKTKAIMAVHYAGDATKMKEVYDFAVKYSLRVIEDAAHSFGSFQLNGRLVGYEGDIICFSFDGIKNITCGEGGAIVSSDLNITNYVKNARLLGVENDTDMRYSGKRSWDFDVVKSGYRYHMSNIMAAIGIAQLKKIDSIREKKKILASAYINAFVRSKNVQLLDLNYSNSLLHIFVIKVLNRDKLKIFLEENGISCGIHYKPNHLLTAYNSEINSLPQSVEIYNQILSIPFHLDLNDLDQQYIIKKISEFYDEH